MICALLMAAGTGSRFGADKLLADLGGRPLVVHSAATLLRGAPRVLGVIRALDGPVAAHLRALGVELVRNGEPGRGLGSSIATGVAASAGASGWLVALADMPWVAPGSVRAVCQALEDGAGIVVPSFHGRRGHPVGFSAAFGEELRGLGDAPGARPILARHPDALVTVAVDDPGILRDVDTPADLDGRQ